MHTDRRGFLKGIGFGFAAMAVPSLALGAKKKDGRPNIILIMVDDMGYSDIGCYGGEVDTPNIDKLAHGGMRFLQFYNNAKCGPTRASLLTGQYSQAVGEKNMEYGATFGEVLRSAGYRTLITGKWHQEPLPTTRGFDRYYGLADGCCNFWNPGTTARPGEGLPGRKHSGLRRWAIEGKAIEGYVPEDKNFYTTDAFTDYAIDRLEEYKDEDKPFVLYLPYTAPHYPLHAWPEDIAKYRGRYLGGWDELRKERYKRQVKMGIIDKKFAPSPRHPDVPAWDTLTEQEKDEADLRMAVYAAMIDRVDQNIGRLMKKLRQLGEDDNTLIMFLTDNGGCPETPDTTPDIPPGPVESYRTIGPEWANASNTPYRKYKSTDHEGGQCTPFIANWPGVIKPGTFTQQFGHIVDIMATMMELSGADYPKKLDGRNLKPMVGKSLVPIFEGKQRKGHDVIYWQFGKAKAIRIGDWKLVKLGETDWELYNLKEDRTELNDQATRYPEKVEKMTKMWEAWLKDCEKKI